METLMATLAVITGLALRLAIPIAITAIAIYFLRRLDAHWQAEAQKEVPLPVVEKPHCWEVNNCSPEDRKACLGYQSNGPCWQAFRKNNGYLKEQCLECEVFQKAPIPAYK